MSETTLDDVRRSASFARMSKDETSNLSKRRDRDIRTAYAQGTVTLGQLAQASGLSKQRVYQITEGKGETDDRV